MALKPTRQLPVQPRRDAWVEINLAALEANARAMRRLVSPHQEIIAVIKADAYGHGAVMVVPVLKAAGIEKVAVASMDEALQLREAGLESAILVLGAIPAWAVTVAAQRNITLSVFQRQHLNWLQQAVHQTHLPIKVHIKVDTGMHRIGVPWKQAPDFVKQCQQLGKQVEVEGLFSHLACAESSEKTAAQWERWAWVLEQCQTNLPPLVHLSNSAGLSSLSEDAVASCNAVRIGLNLLGYGRGGLKPVLGLKARVVHIQELPSGEGVSYGHRYVTEKATRLATLPLGYADGVPRGLSGQLKALVKGRIVPQVGSITMDQLMLDVSDLPDLELGETVTLLGEEENQQLSLTGWADSLGTIEYELMCGLRVRLPRVYVRH